MKSARIVIASILSVELAAANVAAGPYDVYIWETPRVTNVTGDAQWLTAHLQSEVDKILAAGHLAPLRISGSDQDGEGYYQYPEPGRIVTTLAMAYPHLTPAQQQAVKTYLNTEFATAAYTPWSTATSLPPDQGARREPFTMTQLYQWSWWWGIHGQTRPRVAPLYGLWLYAYRSGDWAVVSNNWSAIKSFYSARTAQGGLYGTMGAHAAMARMAQRMNDTAMMNSAVSNAEAAFNTGLDFNAVENLARTYYNSMYTWFAGRGRYHGWMFLDLTPEAGRYLKDRVLAAVQTRHALGRTTFPLWWINRAWYGNGITGHESSGLVPENIGMMFPVERWVLDAPASQLLIWRRSFPSTVGDCYALEASVMAVESTGTLDWVDVRDQANETVPPASPRNLRRR